MQVMGTGEFFGYPLCSRHAGGLSFTDSVYLPGSSLRPHTHVNSFCAVVVAGAYSEKTEGTSYECQVRNLVFHRPGEAHSNRMGDQGARVISIEFAPGWMDWMSQLEVQPPNRGRMQLRALAHLVPRLVAELRADDQASVLALEALTLEMLAGLMREQGRTSRQFGSPLWLRKICKVLEERYHERLSLAELAETARVHPVHLAREFRKSFGHTVGEHIRRLRTEQACRELIHTQSSITEIAARAGFADHSHMSRLVRAYTGYSPRELRRRSRR